jgi:polysaccharide biosynthesis PFTS motif protein
MLHKIKRVNKFAHKKYTRRIKQLSEKYNYIEVHPSVDALQIIQKTKACISMPFTSTALIAKFEGKPSVYYDPSGIICKDDRAAHGIPILNNIEDLRKWVENIDNG